MFDSNSLHSRLCAESSGSNPSMMVSNTKHTAEERCSHLILKTNTDNHPPPPPTFGAPRIMVRGKLDNLETYLDFSLLYFFPWKIILEFSPILKERQNRLRQQGVQRSITITQPHNHRLNNGLTLFKY